MSDNIIPLDDFRPTLEGNAICLQCDHIWQGVAPLGTVELQCPTCKTWKGVFEGMTAPETVLECDCGNQHFYISDNQEAVCAKCGLTHLW